ncbi:hypothetical protein OKHIL_34220 [Mycolicibacterium mageritense]|nr:hypothetical protein MTY414_43650 [Mycolicibacterium mageritense]
MKVNETRDEIDVPEIDNRRPWRCVLTHRLDDAVVDRDIAVRDRHTVDRGALRPQSEAAVTFHFARVTAATI